jgi:hypothetical protein
MKGAATQIASREFDGDFSRLPAQIQALVQRKIDAMGLRLATFQHYRMTSSDKYTIYRKKIRALKVGDEVLISGGRRVAGN